MGKYGTGILSFAGVSFFGYSFSRLPVLSYMQGRPKKYIHTLTKEDSTLYNRLL